MTSAACRPRRRQLWHGSTLPFAREPATTSRANRAWTRSAPPSWCATERETAMQLTSKRREGFALAVAIGAIVVIGALIAGAFFASSQQFRVGRNTLLQTRARTAAE